MKATVVVVALFDVPILNTLFGEPVVCTLDFSVDSVISVVSVNSANPALIPLFVAV